MSSCSDLRSEETILLLNSTSPPSPVNDITTVAAGQVLRRVGSRLYVSHFLSTWNSRVFEFGAVLYLASIFPNTLLPMSIYALTRTVSAIICSPLIGQYVDTANRLQVVRTSIVSQRTVVAASCAIFYILAIHVSLKRGDKMGLLVLLALLACVEKLSATMNMVAVERDWVVVIAGDDMVALRTMNAQMRRIDLACKLLGPLFIALIDGISTEFAIVANLGMNAISVIVEYFSIAQVYQAIPELSEPKRGFRAEAQGSEESLLPNIFKRIKAIAERVLHDFRLYLRHRACLPSFAGALLYMTVLSFGGQMVTYLLSAGYTSTQVGIARTFAVVFEMSATWIAPWLMGKIGPIRAGLWLSCWQASFLVVGTGIFMATFFDQPLASASGLVYGTMLSRLGLRGLDMCTEIIVQEEIEPENRGAFSSIEATWQNVFELCSYISTMVFSQPDQFRWPALISTVAIAVANMLYMSFVYLRRGHLLHLTKLTSAMSGIGHLSLRDRGLSRIASTRDV